MFSVFKSQPNNIFIIIKIDNGFGFGAFYLYRPSYITPYHVSPLSSFVQRHILLPTPTVCGHAEACPSTTYTKYILYLHPIAVAARWLGRYSPQGSRPRGGPRLAALMVQDLYLPQVRKKSTKSEMNHRISLKLCTQVKEKILRTFSFWHFSEKKVLHGFFWVFLVFSHLSHL